MAEKIYRPKSIVLVRHAESAWNALPRGKRGAVENIPPELQGVPDHRTPLTEKGMCQAEITGSRLSEMFGEFQTVYHSPYLRATETAKIILGQFPEKIRDKMAKRFFRNLFIMEQNFGDLDVGARGPRSENYEEFYQLRKVVGKFYLRPPSGESWADVCMRTHNFLDILFRPNRHGQKILVVTHGIAMQTFRYHLERLDEEQLVEAYHADKIKNCGVSHYEWNLSLGSQGRYELKFWNETLYLGS